ncbi:MAG: SHOCT domain-containing protein [Anaerolineaceae bacterium]|nr:SHOCT domain-containing protein [Anaerolineaceae bacterium]
MMGFGMMGGMLVFWVIVIVLAVLLVKGLFNSDGTRSEGNANTAKQILDERYARGEITQEQYQTMAKDIR